MEKFLKTSSSNPVSTNKRPREEPVSPDQLRRPKKIVSYPNVDNKTPTNNRFESLPVDADEALTAPFQNASKKKATNHTPLIIIELVGDWTHQKIKDVIMKYNREFHMQNSGRKVVKVQCYSAKNHQILKDGLLSENIAFYTFTRKDEKLPKAVIKGLPKFVHADIPAELQSLGFLEATVTELKTFHPTECPPLLIQLPIGTNMSKFKQIKYLSNCVVNIEKFKPTKKPGTQCFRCQNFGHASRNCNRPARCVKCAQPHPTWECPKKDKVKPPCCCNCSEEHPANYSQCPVRLKYLERIASKRETMQKATILEYRAHSKSHQTWAKAARSGISKEEHNKVQTNISVQDTLSQYNKAKLPKKQTPSVKQASSEAAAKPTMDLETSEMLEILSTIQSIKAEFSNCETFMEKVILVLNHLGHYV